MRAVVGRALVILATSSLWLVPTAVSPAGAVGNGEVTPVGEFPWTVGLDTGCTGALIAPTWVLTAAHCQFTGQLPVIKVGTYDDAHPGVEIDAVREVPYPGYREIPGASFYPDDLMLVELAHPADAPTVPLARPDQSAAWAPGATAPFAGFGVWCGPAVFGDPPCDGPGGWVLRDADMTMLAPETCGALYAGDPGLKLSAQVCTGTADGGPSPCFGDSGGSLLADLPEGLASFAVVAGGDEPCGDPRFPAVYTALAPYLSWIAEVSGVTPPSPPTTTTTASTTTSTANSVTTPPAPPAGAAGAASPVRVAPSFTG